MELMIRKTLGEDTKGKKVIAEVWLNGPGKAEYIETNEDGDVFHRTILSQNEYIRKMQELGDHW